MDITYAVEHAHDENILKHELSLKKESYLAYIMSQLKLEPHEVVSAHCDMETMRIRQQLLMYKAQMDALDPNDPEYYEKKEVLIFKIFCEFRGMVYDPEMFQNDNDEDLEAVERMMNE